MSGALFRLKEFIANENLGLRLLVSAPGRLDFLNTHQDYKNLHVVGIAIDRRIYLGLADGDGSDIIINALDLGKEYIFSLTDIIPKGHDVADYIRAAIFALIRTVPIAVDKGFRLIISSDIPIGGGMGSSGALLVAFIKLLEQYLEIKIPTMMIAEIAYRAERNFLGVPCGRLDQYTSAFGEVTYLKPTWPPHIEKLESAVIADNFSIIAIDTGIKHRTLDIHRTRQEELDLGLRELLAMDLPHKLRELLAPSHSRVVWDKLDLAELSPYLDKINPRYADRIRFTIIMNNLTKIAVRILKNETLSLSDRGLLKDLEIKGGNYIELLCSIVNSQHDLLRDLYQVSTEKIEKIVSALRSELNACVKISGAGLGGALLALVPRGQENKAIDIALGQGAKSAFMVNIDEGVRAEWV